MARPSWLDLGRRSRLVFAAIYLSVQAALVATAFMRPDHTFAFRMFNESSTIAISLSRRVARQDGTIALVPTGGRWQARDSAGTRRAFSWNDRVRDPIVGTLGRTVFASYGVDAQLSHLQGALDDVMAHLADDAETKGLVAEVEVRQNGRQSFHVRLVSRP
jgi:hypothetical protein